jgi:hypothetical protein
MNYGNLGLSWGLGMLCVALAAPSVGAQGDVPPAPEAAGEIVVFVEAAPPAWSFVDRNYQHATGLVRAHDTYAFVTVWDIGSGLAALFAAHELGLLPRDEYDVRMSRALHTLQELPLFDGAAFNKLYDATTGAMVGRDEQPSERGYGWSALDMGRLLVWLKIVGENHPQHAAAAEQVVGRLDLARLVQDGYLWGEDLSPRRGVERRHQEGRIGYEQYAAAGFELWGHRAERAADIHANAQPVTVLGVELWGDRRGDDRLTSEPFLMMGLELGWWDPAWREQAERMLAAQQERFRQTGQITIVSEDALPDPPNYFYYYALYHNGEAFAIDVQGTPPADPPRWVSAKAAYGWHALFPSGYTRQAVEAVQPARSAEGWNAGVYEGSGRATGVNSINTAALILEAALYAHRGRALLAEGE